MQTHQIRALHAPMFRGLRGLGAALPLSLRINTPYQLVGSKPTFTLIGATPGATVFWSSYKDGTPTGEYNASYGQVVEANGTVELEGGQWTENDIGTWLKEVLIQSPDGTNNRAMVQFAVSPVAAASTSGAGTQATAGGFSNIISGSFSLAGYQIPNLVPIGLAAYLIFKRK